MQTHIQRYTMLVEAITGKKPTNDLLDRIAADFISYRRDQIEAAGFDPLNLTNAQKASVVLDAYTHHGNSVQEAMHKRHVKAELDNMKEEKRL